jgi:hypothetical protein
MLALLIGGYAGSRDPHSISSLSPLLNDKAIIINV